MQTKILEEILAGLPSLNKKWKLFLQNLRTRKHLHFHQQKQILICRKWFRSLKRWKRKRMQMKQNPSLLFCPYRTQQLTERSAVPKVPFYSQLKNRGVIDISHVPHGFYENQMSEFFFAVWSCLWPTLDWEGIRAQEGLVAMHSLNLSIRRLLRLVTITFKIIRNVLKIKI